MTFNNLTKVQINPKTQHVHLAIRITDNHVHNLIFTLAEFVELNSKSVKKWGNNEWEMQKLKKHVKMYSKDYSIHYRFSTEEWNTIKQQFIAEIERHRLHIPR